MGAITALAVLVLVFVQPSNTQTPKGDPRCPCIDGSAKLRQLGTVDAANSSLIKDANGLSVESTWGSSDCKAWDAMALSEQCDPADPQPWCADSWCWVDPANCIYRFHEARTFPSSTGTSPLFYSYTTCGNTDRYFFYSVLNKEHLKVHFVADDARPFVWRDPTATDGLTGYGYELFQMIKTELDFTYDRVDTLPSTGDEVEPWDDCIEAMSHSEVDICCCNFWDTADRRLVADFTVPILANHWQLVTIVETESKNSLVGAWEHMFKPFSGGMWGMIVVGVLVVCLLLMWMEWNRSPDFEPAKDGKEGTASAIGRHFFHSMYMAFVSVFGAAPVQQATTAGAKIVIMGFGMFILVLVSSYTANLAAFLTVSQTSVGVAGITDMERENRILCVPESPIVRQQIRRLHPNVNMTEVHDHLELAAKLRADECQAGWVESAHWSYLIENGEPGDAAANCDFTLVGGPLSPMNFAIAVRQPGMASAMSYYIADLFAKGIPQGLYHEYFDTPDNNCATGTNSSTLGIAQMSGALMILAIGIVLGLIVYGIEMLVARNARVSPDRRPSEAHAAPVVDHNVATIVDNLQREIQQLADTIAAQGGGTKGSMSI
eukprot:TRINITY_DN68099_c2_g2_i3.p1 TRINITY_DN68099_c2_g2~~TRINITY_DN68099_c2_g2_i3.p1  ORF type:complete len:604 (-),score=19.11 TRINITY_DN68099_c2_g2_i3:1281-3092(-)